MAQVIFVKVYCLQLKSKLYSLWPAEALFFASSAHQRQDPLSLSFNSSVICYPARWFGGSCFPSPDNNFFRHNDACKFILPLQAVETIVGLPAHLPQLGVCQNINKPLISDCFSYTLDIIGHSQLCVCLFVNTQCIHGDNSMHIRKCLW